MTVRDAEKAARRIAYDRVRKKEYLVDPEILEIEETSKGKVRLEIMLKDVSGGSVFTSVECYIGGWPNITYGAELGDIEWKFLCDSSKWGMRGSEANKNSISDMISGAFGSVTSTIGNLF